MARTMKIISNPETSSRMAFLGVSAITTILMLIGVILALVQLDKLILFYEDLVKLTGVGKEQLKHYKELRKWCEFTAGFVAGAVLIVITRCIEGFIYAGQQTDLHDVKYIDKCESKKGFMGNFRMIAMVALILVSACIMMSYSNNDKDINNLDPVEKYQDGDASVRSDETTVQDCGNLKKEEGGQPMESVEDCLRKSAQQKYCGSSMKFEDFEKTENATSKPEYACKQAISEHYLSGNLGDVKGISDHKTIFENKNKGWKALREMMNSQGQFSRVLGGLAVATLIDLFSTAYLGCRPMKPTEYHRKLWRRSLGDDFMEGSAKSFTCLPR